MARSYDERSHLAGAPHLAGSFPTPCAPEPDVQVSASGSQVGRSCVGQLYEGSDSFFCGSSLFGSSLFVVGG